MSKSHNICRPGPSVSEDCQRRLLRAGMDDDLTLSCCMYTTYRLGLTTYDLHYPSKGVLKYMAQQDCSRMVSLELSLRLLTLHISCADERTLGSPKDAQVGVSTNMSRSINAGLTTIFQ